MISHRTLALLIGGWAAITWGGRIGLLTGDETLVAKARIALSLLVAIAAVIGLLSGASWRKPAIATYSVVTCAVWITSAVSVLADPSTSLGFKGVHVVLALVSIAVAALAWVAVVRRSESGLERPSEAPSPTAR